MQANIFSMSADLAKLSPLQMGEELLKYEFYSKQTAGELLDQIYEQFKSKESIIDGLVTPAFLHIFDNITRPLNFESYGITPSRLINECKTFRYDSDQELLILKVLSTDIDEGVVEKVTTRENGSYNRYKFDDAGKRKQYRDDVFGNKKTTECSVTGKSVYNKQQDAKQRNFVNFTGHTADVDHIVPIEKIYDQLKNNVALSDQDIKEIANSQENLAIVTTRINRQKGALTNQEYVDKHSKELDEQIRKNLLKMGKEASKKLDQTTNHKVFHNLKTNKELRKNMTKESVELAGNNVFKKMLGQAFIVFAKCTYFEFSDSFKRGVKNVANATTVVEALKIRMKRVTTYVIENVKKICNQSFFEFIRSFFGSLFEMLCNIFVGVIKKAFQIIKQGFNSLVEAIKLIVKPPQGMTKAQIADAVVKIIALAVVSIGGVALETWINSLGIPDPFSNIISAVISGLLVALVTYLLDKADFFNIKREMRMARVEEVFQARIEEIRQNTKDFNKAALQTLIKQRTEFFTLQNRLKSNLQAEDMDALAGTTYELADFMQVEIGYKNTEQFCKFLDENDEIEI